MAENYDLIFGQSASSQYAWSDSDYQNGWQTVGSTPPTAEQFDALQRRSDTKAKDLNNRLSPLETKAGADGRQAATSYASGAMLTVDGLPNGWLLECIVPGISGTDAITLPDTLIDGLTIIDGSVTWALRKVATYGGLGYRQPSKAYTVGDIAYGPSLPAGYCLECTTAGTTADTMLDCSANKLGDTITDGTVAWTVEQPQLTTAATSALAGVTPAANMLPYFNSSNSATTTAISDFIKTLLDDGDAATARATLEANAQNCGGIVAASLTENGYVKFANGLILEWGCVNVSTPYSGIYQDRFTFPVPQRATYVAVGTVNQNTSNSCDVSIYGGTDAVMVQTRVVCTVVVFAVGI